MTDKDLHTKGPGGSEPRTSSCGKLLSSRDPHQVCSNCLGPEHARQAVDYHGHCCHHVAIKWCLPPRMSADGYMPSKPVWGWSLPSCPHHGRWGWERVGRWRHSDPSSRCQLGFWSDHGPPILRLVSWTWTMGTMQTSAPILLWIGRWSCRSGLYREEACPYPMACSHSGDRKIKLQG